MSLLLPFGLSFLTVGFVWRSDSNKAMITLIIASVCHSANDTPVQQQEPQPQFVSQSRFIGNPGFINPGKGKAVQWGKSNLRKVEKLQTLCVRSAEVPASCCLCWLSVCVTHFLTQQCLLPFWKYVCYFLHWQGGVGGSLPVDRCDGESQYLGSTNLGLVWLWHIRSPLNWLEGGVSKLSHALAPASVRCWWPAPVRNHRKCFKICILKKTEQLIEL